MFLFMPEAYQVLALRVPCGSIRKDVEAGSHWAGDRMRMLIRQPPQQSRYWLLRARYWRHIDGLNEEKPAEDTDFGGVAAETPRVRAGAVHR